MILKQSVGCINLDKWERRIPANFIDLSQILFVFYAFLAFATLLQVFVLKYFSFILIILKEMESYIRGLIPNLAQLRDIPGPFLPMYCRIAVRKFFFFCDPHRRGILYIPIHFSCIEKTKCLFLPIYLLDPTHLSTVPVIYLQENSV